MTLLSLMFALCIFVAALFFLKTFLQFYRQIQKGQSKWTIDKIPYRLYLVLVYWLGQKKVSEPSSYDIKPGVTSRHHILIFWGFLVITLGTIEFLIHGVFPSFNYRFLGTYAQLFLYHSIDTFNFLVLLMVGYAFFRRLVLKPQLIPMSLDAAFILSLISILMLSHFGYQSFSKIYNPNLRVGWISYLLAKLFTNLAHRAHLIGEINRWVHLLTLLFFLNYIPYSKHIHIIGSLPNIFLSPLGAKGVMPKLNLEDESNLGVGHIHQFDQKSLLDQYACTECARCSNFCPAHLTQKPLSPMKLIHDLRDEMLHQDAKIPLVGGRILDETLWACTTCGACQEVCPVFIDHPLKIQQMKTFLVLSEGRIPQQLSRTFQNLERQNNPWGAPFHEKMAWAEGLNVPLVSENPNAEYLLFVGCAASFDERAKRSLRALVEILHIANVSFAVLGKSECCSGDPARRAGHELLFQQQATTNIEQMNALAVKKVITNCPHCLHTIRNEYPAFGGHYTVVHHSELIAHLIQEKKIDPIQKMAEGITYHDSCYLGRWNNQYDAPREAIKSIQQKGELIELARNKNLSFCCGAGGGRMWQEETAPRINENRAHEIIQSGANIAAVACPFCTVMLQDGINQQQAEEKVRIYDIAELVRKTLVIKNSKQPEEQSSKSSQS